MKCRQACLTYFLCQSIENLLQDMCILPERRCNPYTVEVTAAYSCIVLCCPIEFPWCCTSRRLNCSFRLNKNMNNFPDIFHHNTRYCPRICCCMDSAHRIRPRNCPRCRCALLCCFRLYSAPDCL